MSRELIPREILEERLREFVLGMREGEVYELSVRHGGNLVNQLEGVLGPEFGEPGRWELQVNSASFLLPAERNVVAELLWAYVGAGILQLTSGPQSNHAWSGTYLTAEGRKILQGGTPIPEDVQAYLRQLVTEAPQLDDTALFYVSEALLAFRARLYPSVVVMLGCAAEHLVMQMAQALLTKLPAASKANLEQVLNRGPIAGIWTEFRKRFDPHRTTIYRGEALTAETALDGLFLAVKNARDDGGHPRPVRTSESQARALLQAFPEYAKAASRALGGIAQL